MRLPRPRWTAVLLVLLGSCIVALGLRSPTPWTGLGFLGTWLTFMLVGSAWLPRKLGAAAANNGREVRLLSKRYTRAAERGAPSFACAFAQLSRSVTVRLYTSTPGFESTGSLMKYPVRSN